MPLGRFFDMGRSLNGAWRTCGSGNRCSKYSRKCNCLGVHHRAEEPGGPDRPLVHGEGQALDRDGRSGENPDHGDGWTGAAAIDAADGSLTVDDEVDGSITVRLSAAASSAAGDRGGLAVGRPGGPAGAGRVDA